VAGTDRTDQLIAELLTGSSIAAAARSLGVGERTARRWLAQPDVKRTLSERRAETLTAVVDRLGALATEAMETLAVAMAHEDATPADRIRAARAVLSLLLAGRTHVLTAHELAEMAERLDVLEGKTVPNDELTRLRRALSA
jgi:transposase-like protein